MFRDCFHLWFPLMGHSSGTRWEVLKRATGFGGSWLVMSCLQCVVYGAAWWPRLSPPIAGPVYCRSFIPWSRRAVRAAIKKNIKGKDFLVLPVAKEAEMVLLQTSDLGVNQMAWGDRQQVMGYMRSLKGIALLQISSCAAGWFRVYWFSCEITWQSL